MAESALQLDKHWVCDARCIELFRWKGLKTR